MCGTAAVAKMYLSEVRGNTEAGMVVSHQGKWPPVSSTANVKRQACDNLEIA